MHLNRSVLPMLMILAAAAPSFAQSPRQRQLFDFDWTFMKGDPAGAEKPEFQGASEFRHVDLPHDWSIEGPWDLSNPTGGPGGFFPAGIGWYRKSFSLPESQRGKLFTIEFDGVYMNSTVFLNGKSLGTWPYGYTSFAYVLPADQLHFGSAANVIAVRVDSSKQPSSRWYSGAGIFRNVWLTATDPLHVAQWGTNVTMPKVSAEAATIRVRTEIQNDRSERQDATLTTQIIATDGAVVASADSPAECVGGATTSLDQSIDVSSPQLWSIQTPIMYSVHSIVKVGGTTVDEYTTPIGIRDIQYDLNKGFLLNGQQVKMQGVCIHHEAGSVGAAVPQGVWERRLRILKEMGCNAIRTSHNPPDPVLLDLCDRMGFVVMDEAFDEWTVRKPQIQFGYSSFFNDWYEKDLTNFIRRDRNHPSVVMWSAGNEIGEQRRPGGDRVLAKLVTVFHREDPTRPVTAGMDNVYTDQGDAPAAFTSLLDIVGYNYVDRWGARRETMYEDDRQNHPNWRFVGTESSSIGGTRGVYNLPPLPGTTAPATAAAPVQLVAPTTRAGRGARGARGGARGFPGFRGGSYASSMIRVEALWKFIKLHDYVIGDFMWTGIDYLGETGGNRKGSGSGQIDTAGFPKDSYYFYQSQWTTAPMIHLMPHWTWPAERIGQIIPVVCYTNCDTVELFVNGKSYGTKSLEFPRQGNAGSWNSYARPFTPGSTLDLHLSWDVAYAPGTLRAVGKRNGQVVCETKVQTAGAPAAIVVDCDRKALTADSRDVAHFTARVVDDQGNLVPNANPDLAFDLQGPATIIGTDNGDLSDVMTPNTSKDRKAFNGMALAIIQATRETGKISMTVSSPGLKPASVELDAQQAPQK